MFSISDGRMVRWCSVWDRIPRAHAPMMETTAFAIEALVRMVDGSAQSARSATCMPP